jgi:plastocyanin
MRSSINVLVGIVLAAVLLSGATANQDKKADHNVKMLDGKFDKMDIKIKVGQSVQWHNDGDKAHTATSDDGTDKDLAFDTKDVDPKKDSKVITFKKAGTVTYHCKLHKQMKGKITIE